MNWTSETVPIAGVTLQLNRAGSGAPLLVLQHDVGTPRGLPFYDALARDATVLRAVAPGLRRLRASDVDAQRARHRGRLPVAARAARGHPWPHDVSVVGLGFGGWIAAEMATMAPARASAGWCWWAPMGIKPERGEIADQALVSYIDYVRLGFADQSAVRRDLRRRAADRPRSSSGT